MHAQEAKDRYSKLMYANCNDFQLELIKSKMKTDEGKATVDYEIERRKRAK